MSVLLSWNVAGRVRSVPDQARAVAQRQADIVALQEVRVTALPAWREALGALGYEHIAATLVDTGPRPPERRLGVLVAARAPVEPLAPLDLPWPERHLAVRTRIDSEEVELHVLHAPISSKAGQVKVLTLETVYAALAPPSSTRASSPATSTRRSTSRARARCRASRGPARAGSGPRTASATTARSSASSSACSTTATPTPSARCTATGAATAAGCTPGKMGYRIDHIIVRGLVPAACEYEHAWREAGLSDHAADLGGAARGPLNAGAAPATMSPVRRLVLLISAVVLVDTMFYAVVAPLLPHYADELGLSKAAAGLLTPPTRRDAPRRDPVRRARVPGRGAADRAARPRLVAGRASSSASPTTSSCSMPPASCRASAARPRRPAAWRG